MKSFLLSSLLAVFLFTADSGRAQGAIITITMDENCNGTINGFTGLQPLPCALLQDPGPGGLAGAVTYNLLNPPGLVAGDLAIFEPGTSFTNLSDLVRFNPDNGGEAVFYSDISDGADSLADIGFPGTNYANLVVVEEVGPEGDNGFTYTPTAGQPGFVAGTAAAVTYVITSDSVATPEPASAGLFLMGTGLFMVRRYATKRASAVRSLQ